MIVVWIAFPEPWYLTPLTRLHPFQRSRVREILVAVLLVIYTMLVLNHYWITGLYCWGLGMQYTDW